MLAPEDIGKNLKKWQNKPVAGVIDGILQRLCKKLRQRLDALEKGQDPEALHDARVEIKRLRVWLKHSRPVLKTRKEGRKMLKAFTQASNPLRDLEVMLAWLEHLEVNSNHAPGVKDVINTTQREILTLREQVLSIARQLQSDSVVLEPKPRKSASGYRFGVWLSDRISEHLQSLLHDFETLPEGLHEARLTGKHLRYLIEPLKGHPLADEAISQLKDMQEVLGTAHDKFAMRERLPQLFSNTLATVGFEAIRSQIADGQALNWREPACWPGMRYIVDCLNRDQRADEQAVIEWRDANLQELSERLTALRTALVDLSD